MQFQYEGRTHQGDQTQGTIAAQNADDAIKRLSASGIQVSKLQNSQLAPIAASPEPAGPAPSSIRFEMTVQQRTGELKTMRVTEPTAERAVRAASQELCRVVDLRDARSKKSVLFRTGLASHKDRSFAFGQLNELIRAGISPAQAFDELAPRLPNAGLAAAFGHASRAALEGGRISDALELYPESIAPSDVGMVRAGEEGGFLPDALKHIADQAMEAHKFQRFFWFISAVIVMVITSIPTGYFGLRALPMAYENYERAGSPPSALAIITQTLMHQIFGFACPITVAALAIFWVVWRYGRTPRMMRWRHAWGVKLPVWGARARQENVAAFCYAMAHVGRAGIAPYRVWWLAANAVPNLEIRDRLLYLGGRMREGSKLSEAGVDAGLLPPEFASIVRTGELTGDMEGSLMRMNQFATSASQRAGVLAKGVGCEAAVIVVMLLAGLMVALFAWVMYRQLPEKVLSGFEP